MINRFLILMIIIIPGKAMPRPQPAYHPDCKGVRSTEAPPGICKQKNGEKSCDGTCIKSSYTYGDCKKGYCNCYAFRC